jgi:Mn2+/Fe2+ NRAMP family transporter
MSSKSLSNLYPKINCNKLIFPFENNQYGGILSYEDESKSTTICIIAIILICVVSFFIHNSSSKTLKNSGYALIAITLLLLFIMCMCYCNRAPTSNWTI